MKEMMHFDIFEYIQFNRYMNFLKKNYKNNNVELTKVLLDKYIEEFLLYLKNQNIEKSEALKFFLEYSMKEEEVKNVKIGDGLKNDKTL